MSSASSNFAALQAMCSSMQSLLGPNKGLKCCLGGDADSSIIGGAMQVMEALLEGNEHPMVQLLYDSCLAQWKSYGSGVTTIVCMAAYWSKEISSLLDNGLPVSVINAVFGEVMDVCIKVFDSTAITLQAFAKQADVKPTPSQSRVLSFSRHFQPPAKTDSQLLSEALVSIAPCLVHGRDKAGRLAARAVGLQELHAPCFDLSLILQHRIIGMGPECCEVVTGVVLPLDTAMVSMTANLSPFLNILVVDEDITPSASHLGLRRGAHVTSHDPKQLFESSSANRWLETCKTVIKKFEVGAIFTSGVVSALLWDYCLGNNIVMVTRVRSAQLQVLCRINGAGLISYITQCSERHLGRDVHLEVMDGFKGSTHTEKLPYCCRVTSHGQVEAVTAILCGRSKSTLGLLCQQFTHCLRVLECACEDGRVVRGGGWTEAACIAEIEKIVEENFSNNTSSSLSTKTSWLNHLLLLWKPTIYQAFADGLRHYIRVVLMNVNTGMGVYEAKTRTEHMVRTPEEDVKVYDTLSSKRESWLKAIEVVKLAMLVTQYTHTSPYINQ